MGRSRDFTAKGSEDFIGHTGPDLSVISATPVMDTNAYASADLLFDPIELVSAFRVPGGHAIIDSVTLLDEDDNTAAGLTLVFTTASTTFGTLNSAPNISDANLRNVVGTVAVVAGDWIDCGGAKVACVRNINLPVKAASGATSLYVAGVNGAGTPTFTASGLKLKIGFRRA